MHNPLHEAYDEAVPVHHSKLLYTNYETRNNNVKCLMRVTQDRVHMLPPHASQDGTDSRLQYTSCPRRATASRKAPAVVRRGLITTCCVLLVSGFLECYGLSLMVMTTVTFRTAGTDPSERRPSTGTIAVRTSPTLWMVTGDVPSENRGTVFDLRTMLRLSWTACSTVWGVEASRM